MYYVKREIPIINTLQAGQTAVNTVYFAGFEKDGEDLVAVTTAVMGNAKVLGTYGEATAAADLMGRCAVICDLAIQINAFNNQ